MGLLAKPVTLSNGKTWKSQLEAQTYFLDMRLRHELNTPIADAGDHEDLLALLERYDEAIHDGPTKIGAGVAHFEKRVNHTNGGTNEGFWAVRIDNSETDFSIIKAVAARGSTRSQQFSDACRAAVSEDLTAAKRSFFKEHGDAEAMIVCEATGRRVSRSDVRADYVVTPIRDIVHRFRVAKGWDQVVPDGVITRPNDAQTITTFMDPVAAEEFRRHHAAIAQIRLVAKDAPAAQLRVGRSNSPKRPLIL